jgi:putative ABC transport system ATP-binding protein
MQLLHQLHAGGATIIMVTHDARAGDHAERVIRLLDGTIASDERNGHARREP